MRAMWFVALACLTLAASADAKRLHLRKPRHGFQMRMTSFVVQPGADREGCEYAVAPNRKAMDVSGFQLNDTAGTHHFVLWEYLGRDNNPADFWTGIQYSTACVGLGPQDGSFTTTNLFGMVTANTVSASRLAWRYVSNRTQSSTRTSIFTTTRRLRSPRRQCSTSFRRVRAA